MAHLHTGPGICQDVMIGPEASPTGQNLLAIEAVEDKIRNNSAKICYEDWTHSTEEDPGYGEVLWEVEGSSNILWKSKHVGLPNQIPDQDFIFLADHD